MSTNITYIQKRYDKEHTIRYSLKLNKVTDREIIEKIERTKNKYKISKQGAIKKLLKK